MKRALPIFAAFAVGLWAGIWWKKPATEAGETAKAVESVAASARVQGVSSAFDAEETVEPSEDSSREDEVVVPPSTVEATVDGSPAPDPETMAAHAARRAKRQAAREAREKSRHDFLSTLNLDLLTAEQRKTHALYVEANETRTAVRKEISALRASGREVPAELQARLADAESVLRADRDAEQRALREAAARAAGLDGTAVRQLLEDLTSIENAFIPQASAATKLGRD